MKKILSIFFYCMVLSGYAQDILTLDQCLSLARQNNRTLQNAALDIEAANEQNREVYAKYYPSISANVMAFQTFDKIIKGDGSVPDDIKNLGDQFADFAGMPISIHELNRSYAVTLSAIEPIYAGGQIHAANQLTELQQDVMTLKRQLTEKDVVQKITEHYWQIATIKYNIRTLDAADKQLQAVYDQVNLFVEAGVTTRNNLLKVKLRQQELASNRLKAENAEHLLLLLLAQEIGWRDGEIDIVLDDVEAVSPEGVYVSPSIAASDRLELQLAGQGVVAQQLQVKMERGKNLPTFAIGLMGYNMGFGGLSESVRNNLNTNMTNGLVFGTLSVPISSWFGGTHAIRKQKIKLQQSRNDYLDVQEKLRIDVESAWSSLSEAYKQIDIAKASVDEASENLRMATDQYRAGTETITDLLDAETLNRQAQDNLSNAKATYQIRLADYLRKVN